MKDLLENLFSKNSKVKLVKGTFHSNCSIYEMVENYEYKKEEFRAEFYFGNRKTDSFNCNMSSFRRQLDEERCQVNFLVPETDCFISLKYSSHSDPSGSFTAKRI